MDSEWKLVEYISGVSTRISAVLTHWNHSIHRMRFQLGIYYSSREDFEVFSLSGFLQYRL